MSLAGMHGGVEVFEKPSAHPNDIVRDGFYIDYRTVCEETLYTEIYHCHTFFELEIVCDGCATHHLNNQLKEARKGYMSLMKKSDFHTYHLEDNGSLTLYCMTFQEHNISSEILREVLNRHGSTDCFLNEEDYENVLSYVSVLHNAYKNGDKHFSVICKSCLNMLVVTLLKNLPPEDSLDEINHYLRDAINYIEQHYTEIDLSLGRVAGALGIGQNYLGQIFSKELKTTYTDYLRNKRLARAIELLRQKRISNDEIARLCGFSSGAYFISVFKKQYGMTPKKYIERYSRF